MRKVTFINSDEKIKKLMIYDSSDEIYLFGYDSVADRPSVFDYTFESAEDAEDSCIKKYDVDKNDWISISDPLTGCQDDFIMPTRVKGRESGNPQWGQFQSLVGDKWIDIQTADKSINFNGMSGNKRLFVSGLLDEFDKAKVNDKPKAIKILKAHGFDQDSINKILA